MDSTNKHSKPIIKHATLTGCTRLNVRSNSSSDASVVGVLDEKSYIKVNVTESVPGWFQVMEPVYGYAKTEFLKVD